MSVNTNMGVHLSFSKEDKKALIKGLDRIKDKFSERKANSEINKIVFQAAKPMYQSMKSGATIGESKTLKKSIGRWRTRSGVRVGARFRKKDKYKGWYVNFAAYPHKTGKDSSGFVDRKNPFLEDAFMATRNQVAKSIMEGVKKLVGKFWMR